MLERAALGGWEGRGRGRRGVTFRQALKKGLCLSPPSRARD